MFTVQPLVRHKDKLKLELQTSSTTEFIKLTHSKGEPIMTDKSGEAKQKAEEKPITDEDLEDISGGIIIQRDPIRTVVPTDTTQGWVDSPDTSEWQDPPDIKN
jgi:hypothetical protein